MLSHKQSYDDKLNAIERVRRALRDVDGALSVPGIVVVGGQSSGKSSVLEHATGLAFPRGEGMCTRVPTVVSVEKAETTSITIALDPDYDEKHEHTHTLDPDDVNGFARAINSLTDHLTPEGQISDSPIYVKYRRLHGPTFTLTDVPGITFLSNEQEDVEKRTTNLTRKMIAGNENTLVLVVLPATDDFHNSKALKIAREEDPEGLRTIAVVTKIDNLPPGSDLVKHMSGEELSLQHGFFAVRNRTQKEVDDGMDVATLLSKEQELFETDPVLQLLPEVQRGMPKLLAKVCEEQSRAIDECVPKLIMQLRERVREDEVALDSLPRSLETEIEKRTFLATTLAQLGEDIRRCVEADTTILGLNEKRTNLSARVHEQLKNMTDEIFKGLPDFLDEPTYGRLCEACKEALGYNLSNFLQGPVFRETFASAIHPLLKDASSTAIDGVMKCMLQCISVLIDARLLFKVKTAVASPITAELKAMVKEELERRADAIRMATATLARAEQVTTYTNNHYLAQTIAKFDELVAKHSPNWRTTKNWNPEADYGQFDKEFIGQVAATFIHASNEKAAIRTMQVTLHAYGKVVHKRFSDSAAILILDGLLFEFVNSFPRLAVEWQPRLLASLVEDRKVVQRRQNLLRNLKGMREAMAELKVMMLQNHD